MPHAGAGTTGPAARPAGLVRPRLGALDMAVHLWRSKWLMLGLFAPLLAIGLAAALTLPGSYTAASRLLVAPGAEYPAAGVGDGAAGELSAQVQSEIELLRSPRVAEAALAKVTLSRAFPQIAHSCRPETCARLGVAEIAARFRTTGAPQNPVILAEFEHPQAAMSAEMLNALVAAYFDYRAEILGEAPAGGSGEMRAQLEEEYAKARDAVRAYLLDNGLTDFAADRDTLRQLYQSASGELLQTRSRLKQAEAQLANYREQIESIPPERELQVDAPGQDALLALKLERQEKLTRFRADSRVIEDLDDRIGQIETDLGTKAGGVRREPNPLYEQIEASIATLTSQVQALRSQEEELSAQITAIEESQRRLVALEPELETLERRKAAAELALSVHTERAARGEGAPGAAGSIRLLEPATPPVRGESLKLPAAIFAAVLALLVALAAGLAKAFTRRGFATPGSAERTLGLPVLASVQKY